MATKNKDIYAINLIYKIFYFITTCLLSYICMFMNRLITKHKLEYLENYNNLFDPNILLNIDKNDFDDLGSLINNRSKEDISRNKTSENKDINSNNDNQVKIIKKGKYFIILKKSKIDAFI